VAVTDTE